MDIERAFQSQLHIVDLSNRPSQLPYTIDFKNMTQTRHYYNTKRDIKRVPLSAGHTLQNLLKSGNLFAAVTPKVAKETPSTELLETSRVLSAN